MSVIATIEISAEDFTLGDALTANPGVHVRLERVIPLGSTFIPYFWAADDSVEAIEAALRTEADIESFTVVDSVGNEALVRVEWKEELDGFLDIIAESNATILEGVGESDVWTFQLRFADHDDLSTFYRECAQKDISIDLQAVHNPGLPEDTGLGIGITEMQRETLQTALDAGYFEVPRKINLVELADRLGVSDTAVSQRLRRGITTLLEATLPERDERSDAG